MMTRKHYNAIADMVRSRIEFGMDLARDGHEERGLECALTASRIGRDFAAFAATDNEHFDRERFYEAAGLNIPVSDMFEKV